MLGAWAAQTLRSRQNRASRRSPWRRCGAWTRCSPASERSSASLPMSASLCEGKPLRRLRRIARLADRTTREAVGQDRSRQGHQLRSVAMGRLHAFPRRWPHLYDEQRRRTRPARHSRRAPKLDIRGFGRGRRRAAAVYTLVETCKLNDIDPQAWLADVLARLPDHPAKRVDELLPWKWKARQLAATAA